MGTSKLAIAKWADVVSQTGAYPDVLFDEYLAMDAASNSRLKDMRRSAAYCRYNIDYPDIKETPAMALGSAVHCAILEPDDFLNRWAQRPEGNGNSKVYKEAVAELSLAGKRIVPNIKEVDGWEMATTIRDKVRLRPLLRAMIDNAVGVEVSVLAQIDDGSGRETLCEVRPDILSMGMVGDIKTTRGGSRSEFARACYTLGYHRSAALYVDAMESIGHPVSGFVFIALENTPPYESALYMLDDDALDLGRREYRALLERYADCMDADLWPSRPDPVEMLSLPQWAFTQEDPND